MEKRLIVVSKNDDNDKEEHAPTARQFADFLHTRMRALGITSQTDLYAAAGKQISQTRINELLSGKHQIGDISVRVALSLAISLDVTLEELLLAAGFGEQLAQLQQNQGKNLTSRQKLLLNDMTAQLTRFFSEENDKESGLGKLNRSARLEAANG